MNAKTNKNYEIDMCHGPLFVKLLTFTVPLILSGILQLMFNAADVIVVGRFAGGEALAAVGATSALTNLLINLFMGLGVGVNVLVAGYYGAHKEKEVQNTVHTAVCVSVMGGVLLAFVGFFLSGPLLAVMKTPDDVIAYSVLYMRIYFAGMPALLLYNFGSAALRAVGDTKRPLLYLTIAGVINVVLNLIFVILLHMGVAGVALATVLSQCVSAYMVFRCLMTYEGMIRVSVRKLGIHKGEFIKILRIGLPAGIQGSFFSVSNVLIQSTINSFGSVAMAGNTAAGNIEGFVYTSMNAVSQASVSFTGQNLGGRQYKRIRKVLLESLALVIGIGLVEGSLVLLFHNQILSLYSTDPEVIAIGAGRLAVIMVSYFLCGSQEVLTGSIRGLGHGIMPMLVVLMGVCGFRILYILTYVSNHRTLVNLYLSYPISWIITTIALICGFEVVYRKLMNLIGEKA